MVSLICVVKENIVSVVYPNPTIGYFWLDVRYEVNMFFR